MTGAKELPSLVTRCRRCKQYRYRKAKLTTRKSTPSKNKLRKLKTMVQQHHCCERLTSPKAGCHQENYRSYHTDEVKKLSKKHQIPFGPTSLVYYHREVERVSPLACIESWFLPIVVVLHNKVVEREREKWFFLWTRADWKFEKDFMLPSIFWSLAHLISRNQSLPNRLDLRRSQLPGWDLSLWDYDYVGPLSRRIRNSPTLGTFDLL